MLILLGLVFYIFKLFYEMIPAGWTIKCGELLKGTFSYSLFLYSPESVSQILHRIYGLYQFESIESSLSTFKKRMKYVRQDDWPSSRLGIDIQTYFLDITDLKIKSRCHKSKKSEAARFVFDVVAGMMIFYLTRKYILFDRLAANFVQWRDTTHRFLNELLDWLMGAPAGLKLNYELTLFLGKFFLYHIYIWIGYLIMMEPYYVLIIKAISFSSCFGLSIMLTLASDTISFLAFHTYCFYVYAAKMYSFQLQGLISLSRLLRGKKWNPLRNRVDSIPFDPNQLAVGTILFTILLFLLPTVGVYYLVFTALRLPILILKAIIGCVVEILNTLPVYKVFQATFYLDQQVENISCKVLYERQGSGGLTGQTSQADKNLTNICLDEGVRINLRFTSASISSIIWRQTDMGMKKLIPLTSLGKSLIFGKIINSLFISKLN